ncbi:lysosomal-associated transmembrane protein 5 [Leptodactylus fuscus]
MNQGRLVMPFLALQAMDFILSLLMFFNSYSDIPARETTFIEDNMIISKLDTQSTEWRYLQMFLTSMTTSSCYSQVPTYLNLKSTNDITYSSLSVPSEKYIKKVIIFSVLHFAVILYKGLMIWCVWKVFKGSYNLVKNPLKDKLPMKEILKTELPSDQEITKMESKDSPPPYSAV